VSERRISSRSGTFQSQKKSPQSRRETAHKRGILQFQNRKPVAVRGEGHFERRFSFIRGKRVGKVVGILGHESTN